VTKVEVVDLPEKVEAAVLALSRPAGRVSVYKETDERRNC